ncbi:MAG TPA: hypothetical protein ENI27_04625 [bacterium]|nr:hypothetical protein [bacterium]
MLILSVVFNIIFISALVYLSFVLRKQRGIVIEKTLLVETENNQRDYWFQKHNHLRERVLHVASEVKDIEIAFQRKDMGAHRATNGLTAIVAKLANDEFRDQYIFSVTEMKEKHEQEAKEHIAQDKLDVARKKANEIELKTPDLSEK